MANTSFSGAPPRHAHGDLTSLAPHERLPEILIVPREKTPTGCLCSPLSPKLLLTGVRLRAAFSEVCEEQTSRRVPKSWGCLSSCLYKCPSSFLASR